MPETNPIETRLAELEQRFSNTVSALTAENSELKNKLGSAEQQLSHLATQAASAALESHELKLSQRAMDAKKAGISPVLVDEVVNAVKGVGYEQKLSMSGSDTSLADLLFGLLGKIPAEHRVNFNQVGAKQNLSQGAGQVAEPFLYEGIINERLGK